MKVKDLFDELKSFVEDSPDLEVEFKFDDEWYEIAYVGYDNKKKPKKIKLCL